MSKPNSKLFLWIVLIFLIGLIAVVARATSLAPMSFDELTRRATAIVHVRCVSTQSVWSAGEIWTDTRFDLLEEIKPDAFGPDQHVMISAAAPNAGAPRDSRAAERAAASGGIVLRQLGGQLDGLQSHVDGVPAFQRGEEVYLFLWRRPGEPYRVLGWAQGTFRVARRAGSGDDLRVTQDSAVAVFRAEQREFQTSGIRNMSLAAFQQKLRQSLSTGPR